MFTFCGIVNPVGFFKRLAQYILRLQAGRRQRLLVGLEYDPLGGQQTHEHARAQSVNDVAQALFGLLQRFLCAPAFGILAIKAARAEPDQHNKNRDIGGCEQRQSKRGSVIAGALAHKAQPANEEGCEHRNGQNAACHEAATIGTGQGCRETVIGARQ